MITTFKKRIFACQTISDYNSADIGQRQLIIGLNAAKTTPSGQYTETLVLTIVRR